MNVPLIEMNREDALAKIDAYAAQLRRRADEEYSAAVAGYRALADGKPLLNLTDAINHAGLGDDGRPRLAIARADRRQVKVEARSWGVARGQVLFDATARNFHQWGYMGSLIISIRWRAPEIEMRTGYAIVPMVPADVRPNRGQLRDYFIMWEVEQWADNRIRVEPDKDPYLLTHLAGDLYVVEAEWDLTPLERAIMSGRRDD